MKRIGIDARFFGSAGKGLGRYTQKLIENLEKIDQKNQYFVFLRKENFEEYQPKNEKFKKVLADYGWYGFSEQIYFPLLLLKYKLDLVHFPHFNVPLVYRKKFVVTIHDLILIHFPTIKNTTLNPVFYWLKFLVYRIVIGSAIGRAEKIIAVSNFTKNDILSNYNVDENRIVVTYEACENFCYFSQKNEDEILKKYGIIKPYFLYVGNAYPHKNLETLVSAFGGGKNTLKDFELVLVGREDYFYTKIRNFVKEQKIEKVIFPGFVPDQELDEIYRNSRAYIFPSLYEGFGLPPLEAMSKGIPVISSDHECMKEVLGDSAFFINAKNIKNISDAMKKFAFNDKLREEFIQKGYSQIEKYSWKEMSQRTLEIYEEIK